MNYSMDFNKATNDLLAGSIDMHVHLNPHSAKQGHLLDVEDYVIEARKAGMRGALVKDSAFVTTGTTYLVNKHSDDVKLFGALIMNLAMGGVNPYAVQEAIVHGNGAKAIFFPLGDSYHHVCYREKFYRGINLPRSRDEGIKILKDGKLIPEAIQIIEMIADADICLCTGHISPEESKALIREARKRGVKKMIVNHGLWKMIGLTEADMLELADEGAYIEFELGMNLPMMPMNHGEPTTDPLETVKIMRKIGVERCIMDTDCGQVWSPSPVEAMRYWIAVMLKCDMEPEEIERMVRTNPAILLNLPEWKPEEPVCEDAV